MNNSQQNKLTMYETVAKVLDENKLNWQNLKALQESVTAFNDLLNELRNKGIQRAKKTSGITHDKSEKKKLMAKKAAQLAGSAFAYATKIKNKDLQAKFNYSASAFNRIDDNNAINLALSIVEEAEKIQSSLSDYGVTLAEIAELKTLSNEFKNSIGEKASVKSGQVAATGSLSELFKEADSLLKNQIDKLLLRLEDSESEFYRTYQNARIIKDLGSRSTKKDGVV
jgi:hypothetical protein